MTKIFTLGNWVYGETVKTENMGAHLVGRTK